MQARLILYKLLLAIFISPLIVTAQQSDGKGKIAILPFEIVSNEPGFSAESMSTKIQTECANSFEKNTSLTVQPIRNTNAILSKNNITVNSLSSALPEDLAKILGVEYVVFGNVEIQNKGTNSISTSSTTYKNNTKQNDNKDRSDKGSGYNVSSSNTSSEYDTHIALEIYNSTGAKEYSERRAPFGNSSDSYKNGMDYMIKRTPFGSKRK